MTSSSDSPMARAMRISTYNWASCSHWLLNYGQLALDPAISTQGISRGSRGEAKDGASGRGLRRANGVAYFAKLSMDLVQLEECVLKEHPSNAPTRPESNTILFGLRCQIPHPNVNK